MNRIKSLSSIEISQQLCLIFCHRGTLDSRAYEIKRVSGAFGCRRNCFVGFWQGGESADRVLSETCRELSNWPLTQVRLNALVMLFASGIFDLGSCMKVEATQL